MIVGKALLLAVRPYPTPRNRLIGDAGVTLDFVLRIEIVVADAVDVGGRAPTMCGRTIRQRVFRRAITPVRRDVDERARLLAQKLEVSREGRYCAGYVPRERPQWLNFAYIDRKE